MTKSAGIIGATLGAISRHPVAATGAGILGVAGVRGAMQASQDNKQIRQQMEAMKQDASTPVAKFAEAWEAKVASFSNRYARFTDKTRAPTEKTAFNMGQPLNQALLSAASESIVKSLATQLFATPINKAFEILKQKFYLAPQQENTLQQALQTDPMLSKAMQDSPEILMGAYSTIKRYAPSLTVDPSALKNFLRQAVALGGQFDPMTIKLLADTEKTIRESRGQLGGHH